MESNNHTGNGSNGKSVQQRLAEAARKNEQRFRVSDSHNQKWDDWSRRREELKREDEFRRSAEQDKRELVNGFLYLGAGCDNQISFVNFINLITSIVATAIAITLFSCRLQDVDMNGLFSVMAWSIGWSFCYAVKRFGSFLGLMFRVVAITAALTYFLGVLLFRAMHFEFLRNLLFILLAAYPAVATVGLIIHNIRMYRKK